jgi:hypothetical protein
VTEFHTHHLGSYQELSTKLPRALFGCGELFMLAEMREMGDVGFWSDATCLAWPCVCQHMIAVKQAFEGNSDQARLATFTPSPS